MPEFYFEERLPALPRARGARSARLPPFVVRLSPFALRLAPADFGAAA
jgi:hypothetical protein